LSAHLARLQNSAKALAFAAAKRSSKRSKPMTCATGRISASR
jgi:branched-subunit amino acid aminotransferase/4-amino-4-deoxychorismate lyase